MEDLLSTFLLLLIFHLNYNKYNFHLKQLNILHSWNKTPAYIGYFIFSRAFPKLLVNNILNTPLFSMKITHNKSFDIISINIYIINNYLIMAILFEQ